MSFDKKLVTKLAKAKTSLVLGHPFFGSLALRMPMSLTDDPAIPTAATNGKWVKFNVNFIEDLSDEEMVFLVAHEISHPMLGHPFRRQDRDAVKWNKAGDYIINKLLVDEGIGKLIEGGLHNDNIVQAGGGTTDGVYNILPDDGQDGNSDSGAGNIGGTGNDLQDGDGGQADHAQQDAEWKIAVAQAAQAAKMAGKLSAGLERLVGEVLKPKVNWRERLAAFMQKAKNDMRTFARPNRRFLSQGMYLPTISGEVLGEVVFCIDCSGSISDHDIAQFAAEIRCVHEDSKPAKLHVMYFDAEVSHYDVFMPDDEVRVAPHGGGGTAFSPLFKRIEQENIEPAAVVFLTDLYCNDFGPAPDYPVMWVTTAATDAPFGEVVEMEDHKDD